MCSKSGGGDPKKTDAENLTESEKIQMYKGFLKRLFDLFFACVILIVALPVFLVIAVAIKLDSKGPVIFSQRRLCREGKEFNMYKFRSMVVDAEKGGVYSDHADPRVTRVGKILRKTSLDELPQCINIIKGEMSFVGFRPPLTYHPWPFASYTQEQKRMFAVRPGITGWAQVNGRKTVEWHKRIELNVWYAEHVSFLLDCKIVLLTIRKVLLGVDNENIGASV